MTDAMNRLIDNVVMNNPPRVTIPEVPLYSFTDRWCEGAVQHQIRRHFNFPPYGGRAKCIRHEIPGCQACTTIAIDLWEAGR